jgi:anti-sigma B factor antagonist
VTKLTVETSADADAVRVAARGELDLLTAARLERALEEAESSLGARRLVLDYSGLEFMDSTGLQVLLDADVRAAEAGWELVVAVGESEARRVLELVDVLSRLQVAEVR